MHCGTKEVKGESIYLRIGHISIDHYQLCLNVISLLRFIQRSIVPFEEFECGMKGLHTVVSSHPSLIGGTRMESKAVPSVRITRCYNENIPRNRLEYEVHEKGG